MAKTTLHRPARVPDPQAATGRASVHNHRGSPDPAAGFSRLACARQRHSRPSQTESTRTLRILRPWRKFSPDAYGESASGYLLVGEAPGRVSWQKARRFTGPAGLLIRRALAAVGHPRYRHLEDLFYMTDAVKCHPAPSGPMPLSVKPEGNRSPRPRELRACSPYLRRELHILRPNVIVTFGKQAAQSVEAAVALCATTPEMAGWSPVRIVFPHPSPRNQRTILQSYPSMRAFERAITSTFRKLINRLEAAHPAWTLKR
jgi:uracil-DNA glycosylase family 4